MGDTMVELSLQVADAWDPSPDVAVKESVLSAGGSAANFAAFTAALGVRSLLATNVGRDFFGEFLLDDMTSHGIDTRLVRRHSGRNSLCVISIGEDGDRRFLSYRAPEDARNSMDEYLEQLLADLEMADWLHVSGFWLQRPVTAALVESVVTAAALLGIPVSLDPSPQLMEHPSPLLASVLSKTEVIFPNAYEACAFTRAPSASTAAEALGSMGLRYAVVTDGAAGSLLVAEGVVQTVTAVPGPVVDTTGAGDALAAGFVAARLAGADALEALRMGSKAAALAIRHIGGHAGCDDMRSNFANEQSMQSNSQHEV